MQQKDMLIQQQQRFQQILIDAIQKEREEEPDKEPVVGDIVSVKKFDWQFLEADLPTLLRRLKERFGRKKPE